MSQIAPARACAFAVIRRVFEQGAYADRALHAEAAALTPRDRQLAMALAYGTVQRARTLDHVLGEMCARPLRTLAPPVLAALRLGCFQLLFMDGIAEHAAVNDAVELSKRTGRGPAQLVNAVLRRATREARGLLAGLGDETPQAAAILYSVPDWLAALWWEQLGPDEARALLYTVNQPAQSALRVNTLRASVEEVRAQLEVAWRPAPELPEGLVLDGPLDAHGTELWRSGAIMPQSRGSMIVARTLEPRAGERVLDLCAAPGAKTTHLAALIGGASPEFRAVEVHPGRAQALRRTCARMGAGCVEIVTADARTVCPEAAGESRFARVLVDPPCSGLGTLQSRPDLRWQARRGAIDELARKQAQLLAAGARATASGGVLVYSLCTISRAEGDDVVAELLAEHADFALEHRRQLLPNRDGTDGFFIARLRRD
ncbi:MAG: 16S rRNA (cytosine(967)-C(5))-methyltransferase RsmB [Solirubrobacteraceae bacterium]